MSLRKKFNIAKNYLLNRFKACEFAITNACIAKCDFCDIWKQQPKVFVDKKKAELVINRLADFGVGHLTFTGGEPLLHPAVIDFVKLATKRSMHNAVLDAAPSLLMRGDILSKLEDSGCDLLSISFDSGDPATMEKSRKIPHIMDQMAEAMVKIKKTRIKAMASVLIWNNNYYHLEDVCKNAVNMGYDFISLNYPTFSKSQVYPLGGEAINFTKEDVIHGLEQGIKLHREGKYHIINSDISMQNIINYLRDPATVKYPCHGGRHVLFVDWFFDVRPCMQLPCVMGNMLTMKEKDFRREPCNDCNMSWYRDFSTLFQGFRSLPILFESLSKSGGIL
ncbi:MAG: radical SAM protein [Treponema sp.]|jgi:MoaA/NifB/PqqE/SkfB family radical SAM enzyme|nr:radical SAM protein [Treponema sp.]